MRLHSCETCQEDEAQWNGHPQQPGTDSQDDGGPFAVGFIQRTGQDDPNRPDEGQRHEQKCTQPGWRQPQEGDCQEAVNRCKWPDLHLMEGFLNRSSFGHTQESFLAVLQ